MYLRFVWGRSRLPLTSKEFQMKHTIEMYLFRFKLILSYFSPFKLNCFLSPKTLVSEREVLNLIWCCLLLTLASSPSSYPSTLAMKSAEINWSMRLPTAKPLILTEEPMIFGMKKIFKLPKLYKNKPIWGNLFPFFIRFEAYKLSLVRVNLLNLMSLYLKLFV